MTRDKRALAKFLAISLIGHGMLLLLYSEKTFVLSGAPMTVLSVKLTGAGMTAWQPNNKTVKTAQTHKSPQARLNPGRQARHSAKNLGQPERLAATARHGTALDTVTVVTTATPDNTGEVLTSIDGHNGKLKNNNARASVEAQVLSELARYFNYPSIARQRGWQGKVLLGFNVETDGTLGQIRVAHSSGYAVLDHSALDSLSKVKTLTDAGLLPTTRIIGMQIPVIYRLEN